jgi:excisionase family DNA binding protein
MTLNTHADAHSRAELLLTAAEVAAIFRVSQKTVGRWGRSGAIPMVRTIGGHHRYRVSDVGRVLGVEPTELLPVPGSPPSVDR